MIGDKDMAEIEGYYLPDELYYTKDHTWARIEDDGTVTVGLDAFGSKAAGNIEFIDLPMEEDEFELGEAFGSLESAKWVGGLLMPVSGMVSGVNESIEDDLTILSEDPYGDGWLIKIKPSDLKDDLTTLIHGNDVGPWLKKEIQDRKK
jgi:glycine cleavage system H protein